MGTIIFGGYGGFMMYTVLCLNPNARTSTVTSQENTTARQKPAIFHNDDRHTNLRPLEFQRKVQSLNSKPHLRLLRSASTVARVAPHPLRSDINYRSVNKINIRFTY